MTERARDPYVDRWTPVHLLVGVVFGVVAPEFWALLVLVLWEPFVLLVLAPRLRTGDFAFITKTQLAGPTLRNVLVDLVADVVGVIVGAYLVRDLVGAGPLVG